MHGPCAVPAFGARGPGLRLPWKRRIAALGVAVFLLAGNAAQAAPDTAIDISATVLSISNCRFRTTSATLAFGVLQPWNPVDVTVTAQMEIRCAGNAAPLATYIPLATLSAILLVVAINMGEWEGFRTLRKLPSEEGQHLLRT